MATETKGRCGTMIYVAKTKQAALLGLSQRRRAQGVTRAAALLTVEKLPLDEQSIEIKAWGMVVHGTLEIGVNAPVYDDDYWAYFNACTGTALTSRYQGSKRTIDDLYHETYEKLLEESPDLLRKAALSASWWVEENQAWLTVKDIEAAVVWLDITVLENGNLKSLASELLGNRQVEDVSKTLEVAKDILKTQQANSQQHVKVNPVPKSEGQAPLGVWN